MSAMHLTQDILHAIAGLTDGVVGDDKVNFAGGFISELRVDPTEQRVARFRLVLDNVDTNQLTVILGLMQHPPVIDLTPITMEPDGTSVAYRKQP